MVSNPNNNSNDENNKGSNTTRIGNNGLQLGNLDHWNQSLIPPIINNANTNNNMNNINTGTNNYDMTLISESLQNNANDNTNGDLSQAIMQTMNRQANNDSIISNVGALTQQTQNFPHQTIVNLHNSIIYNSQS